MVGGRPVLAMGVRRSAACAECGRMPGSGLLRGPGGARDGDHPCSLTRSPWLTPFVAPTFLPGIRTGGEFLGKRAVRRVVVVTVVLAAISARWPASEVETRLRHDAEVQRCPLYRPPRVLQRSPQVPSPVGLSGRWSHSQPAGPCPVSGQRQADASRGTPGRLRGSRVRCGRLQGRLPPAASPPGCPYPSRCRGRVA